MAAKKTRLTREKKRTKPRKELFELLHLGKGRPPSPELLMELAPLVIQPLVERGVEFLRKLRIYDGGRLTASLLIAVLPHLPEGEARRWLAEVPLPPSEAAQVALFIRLLRLIPDQAIRDGPARVPDMGPLMKQLFDAALESGAVRKSALLMELVGFPEDLLERPLFRLSSTSSDEGVPEDPRAEVRKKLDALPLADRQWLARELVKALDRLTRGQSASRKAVAAVESLEDAPDLADELELLAEVEPPEPPAQVVNLGVARVDSPELALVPDVQIAAASEYFFWVEIGEPLPEESLSPRMAMPLPSGLPSAAVLDVAVFGFEGELRLLGPEVGRVRLQGRGSHVIRPASEPAGVVNPSRLFFRFATPVEPGTYHLRCNVYLANLLLQSHLVTVQVAAVPGWVPDAQARTCDYALSGRFDPAMLAQVKPNRLSVMLNENADGTHSLHYFGEKEFKSSATLNPLKLGKHISLVRNALAKAAYGAETPWDPNDKRLGYRYEGPLDLPRLTGDLVLLAIRGYRLYAEMVTPLAGGPDPRNALQELLIAPAGRLQIALKQAVEYVFPAALVYDYDFDTQADAHTLCPTFVAAVSRGDALEQTACFQGACPSRGKADVICPSGFWGFRHSVGIPISLQQGGGDAPTTIAYSGGVDVLVSVSTDPAFTERDPHIRALSKLVPVHASWEEKSRQGTLDALRSKRPHVVYFYCHGGITDSGLPFILVGDPKTEKGITRDNLNFIFRNAGWRAPLQPLVFLNGCHTTALTPEGVMNLAEGFVVEGRAAGVMGTEITLFEPLARAFAEDCLRRFFAGEEIGMAVRSARLALLAKGNPLGLVYIPFVMPGLRLVPQQPPQPTGQPVP